MLPVFFEIFGRKLGYAGFASLYVGLSWDDTELINKTEIGTYSQLVTIDEKLGTNMTEQLFQCIRFSFRKDLFEVWKTK